MASGTLYIGRIGGTNSGFDAYLGWSSIPNTEGNYSTVSVEYYWIRVTTTFQSYNANATGNMTIGSGNTGNVLMPFETRGSASGTKHTIYTWSYNVYHDTSGNASPTIGIYHATGVSLGTVSGNWTVSLDNIPQGFYVRVGNSSNTPIIGEVYVGNSSNVPIKATEVYVGNASNVPLKAQY